MPPDARAPTALTRYSATPDLQCHLKKCMSQHLTPIKCLARVQKARQEWPPKQTKKHAYQMLSKVPEKLENWPLSIT